MTIKQDRFITEYIKTGNGTQSAIKAGYSPKTARLIACENITKPYIKEKIERAMSKEAEKLGINAEFVLKNLSYFAKKKKLKSANAALKANELLGKHLKLFHDNEVDLKLMHQSKIAQLEELE